MKAKYEIDDRVLNKIDEAKRLLGIKTASYTKAIEKMCDSFFEMFELNEALLELFFSLLLKKNDYNNPLVCSDIKGKPITICWEGHP